MPVRPIVLWLVTAALLGAAPARAQEPDPVAPFVGKLVVSVRLEVEGRLETSPALLSLIDVKVQQPFTREAYASSTKRLQRLAPYAAVDVQINEVPGGLQVVFVARPLHPVDTMQFIDDAHVNLERRVKERYGGVPIDIDPELVKAAVLDILAGEGFADATVAVDPVVTHNPCRATVVFHVTAGPLARIGRVELQNLTNVPNPRLIAEVGLEQGAVYKSRAINDALTAFVNRLKKEGYYSASYVLSPPVPTGDHTFDLTVLVDPGPHVVLRWAKGSQPPSGNINDFVPIVQQNAVDDDLLNDSEGRIKEALRNQGYLNVAVTHTSQISPTGEMVITYEPVKGPRYRIERVEIPDHLALKAADVARLLGLKRGDVLEFSRLQAGLDRIRSEYLREGYYRVTAGSEYEPAANRPPTSSEVWVVLRPKIVEGPKGVIEDVQIVRDTSNVPEADLRLVIRGSKGQPYQQRANEAERYALEGLYLNLGFRQAKVVITPKVSEDGRAITRVVQIFEGPLITVGDIRVVGWKDVSEKAIREELTLGVGQPYSEASRLESRRRINGMGVFSRVSVQEDPLLPGETTAHVVVRVVEAPDLTIGFGGGVEAGRKARLTAPDTYADRLEFAPRGFMEIDRHNLGGRNRTMALFTRISLRPRDSTDYLLDGKGYRFSEYKATLTYREKRAFRSDTDWVLSLTSEQAIRTSFNFQRNAASADFLRRLSERTTATLRYSLDFTRLYNVRYTATEKLDIDRIFNQVRLSMLSFAVVTDHRDDALAPSSGTFTSEQVDLALRGIGSEVGFGKIFLQASGFRRITESRRVVAALRGEIGLAHGFARPAVLPDGTPTTVADLPASQRFFAGGSTTVRGFPLDRLGVPDVLTPEGLPLGGNALVVLNAELRTVVGKLFGRNFSVVQFMDAGNVFAKARDVRLGDLRATLGAGMRYASQIGTIRLDYGFKLSRHIVAGQRERGWEYHFSFGEAF